MQVWETSMFGCSSLVRLESLFACLFSGWWSGTGGPSALQLAPPKMAGLWGTVVHVWPVSACVFLSFIRGKKKKENQQFSHFAIRCFYGYVVQAAGPCERVRGGGPWEKCAAFGWSFINVNRIMILPAVPLLMRIITLAQSDWSIKPRENGLL